MRGLKQLIVAAITKTLAVAPSRVRGLKQYTKADEFAVDGRTFTGAWIETFTIENVQIRTQVAPSRVRGLKLVQYP